MTLPDPLLLALALPALVTGVYWSIALSRVVATVRTIPALPRALTYPEQDDRAQQSVCLLVPAHNEQRVIGDLARSLTAQDHPDLRVVFCLDRCTDATRDELDRALGETAHNPASPRFEVLEIDACPPGWAGKVNALWQGVRTSEGARDAELLAFADADTLLAPPAVRAACAMLAHRHLDALSLLSTLSAGAWFERVVQPAASLELMRQYPLVRANLPGPERRPFANGQFMLFTRDAYERVGGHEAVHEHLLEDIALARAAHRAGLAFGLFLAGPLLHCTMYPDYPTFRRGWKRIYTEAANRKSARLRKHALGARIFGVALPLLSAGAVVAGLVSWATRQGPWGPACAACGLFGLGASWLTLAMVYRLGGATGWLAPSHPIGAWLVASVLADAARDLERGAPTEWGGMTYHRQERS